jgi:flavodoxin
MRIKVLYASKTGNTKKVGQAIGAAFDVQAESIDEAAGPIEADLLFLGGAVYATHEHGLQPALSAFVSKLDPRKIGTAAVFCTGFEDKAVGILKGLLSSRGVRVAKRAFFCRGKFLLFNLGHPDAVDLEDAKDFARRTAESLGAVK